MKQLFCILSVAALIATGCQKRASEAAADVEGNQLTVNASVDGVPVAQTRAAGTDVDLKTHGFYLAGYHTTGQMATDLANAYPNVFNKEVGDQQVSVPLVTYTANGNGGKFVLKTIKWALDDITYLSFFGWSQSKLIPTSGVTTATTGIIGQTKDDNDKGYPWIDIRNADAPADQTDVVGSRSLDHKNDAVVSAVDLDFRHLLTKLTFKAKSSSGANVAITAVNIKYATNKVRKKARYTFGSEAATIGAFGDFDEYHSGTVALNTTYPAVTNGAEAILGSALLIPQQLAEGDVSIEIKYQVSPNSGDLTGSEQTKTLPLAAFTFEQGNNYLYVIDIQASEVFVPSYPIITNWDVITSNQLPVVAGPMDGNTLLLLDGYDKPYTHTDGKAYWLDRSGYNNHCEIVGYDPAMYSAAEHTYTFNNSPDRYLKVPLLRSVTALTVSVIAQQTPGTNGNQTLINLENGTSNTRPFFTHVGYNGSTTVYFDTGAPNVASGRLSYNVSSTSVFDQRTLWTFQKQDRGMQRIYQNAVLKAEVSTTSTVSLSALSGQLCSNYAGEVSYVRVVGALQPAADMVADYQEQKKRFNIEPTNPVNPPSASDYVKIGSLYWALGNLVATSSTISELNGCKVGAPTDGGLYFQFGSLIGWKGGAAANGGTGVGVNPNTGSNKWWGGGGNPGANIFGTDAMVWPTAMDGNRPAGWPSGAAQAAEANAFQKWFFDFSGTSGGVDYSTDFSDIRDYTHPTLGVLKEGKMASLGVGDPCTYYLGGTWRMPTAAEYKVLFDNVGNGTAWSSVANWSWVTSPYNGAQRTGSSLYFPASGYRYTSSGGFAYVTETGFFRSSSVGDSGRGYFLSVGSANVWPHNNNTRSYGFPVRCVSEAP